MPNDFCTIEEALADLKAGRMIVLVDDEHRILSLIRTFFS